MNVLVAASGTGGHLFPARYLIEALQKRGAKVDFIGSGRPLEEKIIGVTGVPQHVLPITGVKNLGLKGLIRFLLLLPGAFVRTWKLFSKIRPEVVIGVGGYVTFLPVSVAFLRRVPRWIHEAELSPGLANQVLSFYANTVSLAFAETKLPGFAKLVFTGHPVRPELLAAARKSGLNEKAEHLLVLGGSQGANALDLVLQELAPYLASRGIEVWHQCREENRHDLEQAFEGAGVSARVMTFIDELPEAYSWADAIVSRAGAGAVSEIAVVGKPTVFVPFPYAQGDHQAANAEFLVKQGRAIMVREGADFRARLQAGLDQILGGEFRRDFAERLELSCPENASEIIAEGALALVKR